MHPAFLHWWKSQRHSGHGCHDFAAHASCGPTGRVEDDRVGGFFAASDGDAGSFGVRRPLRFMAHKLDLDPEQVETLAGILDDLKTERAQAAVDDRRTLSAFAETLSADGFDEARAQTAAELRVKSAERLRDAVVTALRRTHGMLTPEQRKRLATLLRTGTLVI